MDIKLSVCIPMYNEEKIASDTARTLTDFMTKRFGAEGWEIIFSNDGSKDSCASVISDFSKTDGRVRLVGYKDNRGKGSAVRTAVLAAEGDYILYTDCDLAYGCDVIADMYEALAGSEYDIMIGSRNISADGYEGYTALRRIMSKTYIKVISIAAGFRYTDSQCGIKCFKKDAAHKIFRECTVDGFAFDLEALILADIYKYKVGEKAVKIINHRESESKVNPIKDALKMLRDVSRIKKIHKSKKLK
ncbi:MAG: glycosyltransferase [Firmicutes bacterium]|nr:glycosyltransferase [Bacillota bacterium]